jgi:MFS family permease
LRNRWGILAVLFTVRLTMGFQFQSVAAVAPLLGPQYGASLADIGLLIGLYFTPGVALSLPGGAIGQKFGDKITVIAALVLMLVGGAGGVLLNVQMTKMVTDWFAGKEIATAMAVFVVSWPAGVALSLLALPAVAVAYGVSAVGLVVAGLVALGIVLLAATYRSPDTLVAATTNAARPDLRSAIAVIIAGLIWGLFNVGFAAIFSFGPSMLVERGWSIASAGSAVSIVLWLAVLSVPCGGFLADRTGRPQTILIAGSILFAMLMLALPREHAVITTIAALGLVSGLPAGSIMSLPARALKPATRAIGMGVFYTVYYGIMMLGPIVGGACAKSAGSAAAAFDFGAVMLLACPLLLWAFNRIAAPQPLKLW